VEGDQEQLVPPEPESRVEAPAQIVADPEATAVGIAVTVTRCESCPEQLDPDFVTVTPYVVVETGETLIVCVVCPPGLQRYESKPDPASSWIDCPAQLDDGPVIVGEALATAAEQLDSTAKGVSAVPGQSFFAVTE
jgi:hypothetical protein